MSAKMSVSAVALGAALSLASTLPCAAQVWNWDLPTTGTFTETSTPNPSTSFFPAPPSGTAYAITQTADDTGSRIELGDPGIAAMGTGSAIQLVSSHGPVGSSTKATIHEWDSTDQFQLSFDLHLPADSPDSTLIYFYALVGSGVRFTNTQGINAASGYGGIRLAINPEGATPSGHWGWTGSTMGWLAQAPTFPRDQVVRVEIYGNRGGQSVLVEHASGDVVLGEDEIVYFVDGEIWGEVFPGNQGFVGNVESAMFYLTRSTAATGPDLPITIGNITYGNVAGSLINTVPEIAITQSTFNLTQGDGPTTASIALVTDAEDADGDLTVAITDDGGYTGALSVENLNGEVVVTADAPCGTDPQSYTVTLEVSDSEEATDSATFDVVIAANDAPTLGSYDDLTVAIGSTDTATPDAPPADANDNIVSVEVSPATLTGGGTVEINPETGVVTVTTTSSTEADTYTITVTVTDACGEEAVSSFSVTVPTRVGDWMEMAI